MTIKNIVSNELCIGCGTCYSICPRNAISFIKKEYFEPKVNTNRCIECGLCERICPGAGIDYNTLNKDIFGMIPSESEIGNYESCFVGYAKNEELRFNSSSGGLVTAILLYLLKNRTIDGAIVTRFNKDNPFVPESIIAKTPEEIVNAARSKYCPVAVNAALKDIISNHDLKIAYVGLPCHIVALRKLEQVFPGLKEKIVLRIGLFCGMVRGFSATVNLFKGIGFDINKVKRFEYRGEGWPGSMKIELNDNSCFLLPCKHYYPYLSNVYLLNRCLFCTDSTAELSDISFGDAWFKGENGSGESLVISRMKSCNSLLCEMRNKNIINIKDISIPKKTIESVHYLSINSKARFTLLRLISKKVPFIIKQSGSRPTLSNYLSSIKFFLLRLIWKTKIFRFLFLTFKAYNYNHLKSKVSKI